MPQDGSAAARDEESNIHRALLKYLDAWSLEPHSWEFNLHVGRLLLLQGRSEEAQRHLRAGLEQQPLHIPLRLQQSSLLTFQLLIKSMIMEAGDTLHPCHIFVPIRFLTGLALLLQQEQDKTSGRVEKEAALLLHQGLELFISQCCSQGSVCMSARQLR